MQFIPPFDQIGVTPPGPWTNAAPQAGVQGSIVNADVFPAVQNEILNVIAADPSLTPSATDLTQLLKAIKYLIPIYAPAPPAQVTYGATSQGGLAKDGSNNFLLSLIQNLIADNRSAPVAADVLALGRAADGAMVKVSASALATYILSNLISSGSVQQVVINPVLYVRTDGNDNNNGLANTAAGAFATIGAALAKGTSQYTFSGSSLTIQLGIAGTYASPTRVPKGTGTIIIQGDSANQGNYIIAGAGTSSTGMLYADVGCTLQLTGVTLSNTGAVTHTLRVNSQASATLSNVTLICTQANNPGAHFAAIGGSIEINGGCIANGSMAALLLASTGLIDINTNVMLTIQGNATYSNATALCTNLGQIILEPGTSFTTTGTITGSRYSVQQNAIINTNGQGANAFPGSTAGTKDSSAAYYA